MSGSSIHPDLTDYSSRKDLQHGLTRVNQEAPRRHIYHFVGVACQRMRVLIQSNTTRD